MTISPLSSFPIAPAPAAARTARPADVASPAPAQESSLLGTLSNEEREFFAQAQRIGPVSYGRSGVTAAPVDVPLGQHLDLRA